ncbi:hypothetical protein DPM17_01650 [Polynucleobacter paneuropaeus]|uniref:glycosyltransferase family 25 protein n=1 Tax=Polynucleobacter paneuropaeus TaxID=2527775 RepID=UPI000DBF0B7D|nr:glycosyltransferase family 25 protein [Polynucleobacter paneuropaeus]AWW47462.1 hypothetical protein DPM17_01650 [Polynucleobacter paneuropaeus]
MKTSIAIALIHNNNNLRNDYLRPKIDTLLSNLEEEFSCARMEVSFQTEVVPHSIPMAFIRDCLYKSLDRRWRKYRLLKQRLLPFDWMIFFRKVLLKYVFSLRNKAKKWAKNSYIEMIVTAKHIRAWEQFLEMNVDYLIVFEDDVIFQESSALRLSNLLSTLGQKNKLCYVDLGGGAELSDLMVDRLLIYQEAEYRHYKMPVTNTACAYLIGRELAEVFSKTLVSRPWLRLIGIDWMINNIFILNKELMQDCLCMHADPTIFKHGTTTGDYISWQLNKLS